MDRCPADDALLDLARRPAASPGQDEVSLHVAGCARCRSALAELEALVDEAARDRPGPGAAAEARVHAAIEAAGRRIPRRRRAGLPARWAAAAAAALVAAAGLVGSGLRTLKAEAAVARFVSADARVVVRRGGADRPAAAGMDLLEGDTVAVPADATAVLDLADASRAELGPESAVTLHEAGGPGSLDLERGFLDVDASRRRAGPPLVVRTPDALAEVVGTRFTLGADAEETHLRVSEGTVHLVRIGDGASVDVAGGHSSEVSGGRDGLRSRPSLPGTALIISSHDRAPAHFERFDRLVGDRLLGRRLRHLGFRVETKGHRDVSAADLAGRPLVIVSFSEENVGYEQSLGRIGLGSAGVPVLCFEPAAFPALGMSGPRRGADFDWGGGKGPVDFPEPGHPLSAGLSGSRPDVFHPASSLGWARPGPGASIIAALPGEGPRAVVFAYEAGARMADAPAPGRRIGLFLDPEREGAGAGAAWNLVEAAVEWCVEPPRAATTPGASR